MYTRKYGTTKSMRSYGQMCPRLKTTTTTLIDSRLPNHCPLSILTAIRRSQPDQRPYHQSSEVLTESLVEEEQEVEHADQVEAEAHGGSDHVLGDGVADLGGVFEQQRRGRVRAADGHQHSAEQVH